jgi:hypothetical protein
MISTTRFITRTHFRKAAFPAVRGVTSRNEPHGTILDGAVPFSPEFYANKEHMNTLVSDLNQLSKTIHAGGGEAAKAKHHARGKLHARERIDALLDAGSPFLEVGMLAGHEMYEDNIPSGGIVTGIGVVNGYVILLVNLL